MIRPLLIAALLASGTTIAISSAAQAKPKPNPVTTLAPVTRAYVGDFPIATTVTVPAGYDTIYVSGQVPDVTHPEAEKGSLAAFGTTEEQTVSVLTKIQAALKAQGADLGDVVNMRVYLAGDPAQAGKMDFAGMMKGYNRSFGTPEQPNKPTRATVQVAALVAPGYLVEIECVAVKKAR